MALKSSTTPSRAASISLSRSLTTLTHHASSLAIRNASEHNPARRPVHKNGWIRCRRRQPGRAIKSYLLPAPVTWPLDLSITIGFTVGMDDVDGNQTRPALRGVPHRFAVLRIDRFDEPACAHSRELPLLFRG